MTVTNKMNLPEALVKAVSTERHNKAGEYSATTLLKDATEVILSNRHFNEIEIDASDSIWQIFGTAVHAILENQSDNTFKEEQFKVKVSNSVVTGRVDSYDMENEILADWKTASVWKVQFKDFSDWYKQGMIYAWLMKQSGLKVRRCRFIAILKDHSKSKARFDREYPPKPVYEYQFDVTEKALAEIEKYIFDKVKSFEEAEKIADSELPPCSKESRWASDDKYAAMKKGRKTALKLCDSEEEAKNYPGCEYVEFRKGESRKCQDYCTACKWCPFYNKEVAC